MRGRRRPTPRAAAAGRPQRAPAKAGAERALAEALRETAARPTPRRGSPPCGSQPSTGPDNAERLAHGEPADARYAGAAADAELAFGLLQNGPRQQAARRE